MNTYVFLEFIAPDGTYYGRCHPRSDIPGLLAWCASQGIATVDLDETETKTQ